MATYTDIRIADDDLAVSAAGTPEYVHDVACIAQDLVHAIRESGLLVELIGNRDAVARQKNIVAITLLAEQDYRIIPGTANIVEPILGEYWLYANTILGDLQTQITRN